MRAFNSWTLCTNVQCGPNEVIYMAINRRMFMLITHDNNNNNLFNVVPIYLLINEIASMVIWYKKSISSSFLCKHIWWLCVTSNHYIYFVFLVMLHPSCSPPWHLFSCPKICCMKKLKQHKTNATCSSPYIFIWKVDIFQLPSNYITHTLVIDLGLFR